MQWHRTLLFGSFLAALVGCSSPPVLLNASEEGVIVRYSPGSVTTAQALAAAQASCAKYGRHAEQQGTGLTGDVFVTFSCVK
jgi:hypothetical protein